MEKHQEDALFAARVMAAVLLQYQDGQPDTLDMFRKALPTSPSPVLTGKDIFFSGVWAEFIALPLQTVEAIARKVLPEGALESVTPPSSWGKRLLCLTRLTDVISCLKYIDPDLYEFLNGPGIDELGRNIPAIEKALLQANPHSVLRMFMELTGLGRFTLTDMDALFRADPILTPGQKTVLAVRILGAMYVKNNTTSITEAMLKHLPAHMTDMMAQASFWTSPSFWQAFAELPEAELLAISDAVLSKKTLEATPSGLQWPRQLFKAIEHGHQCWFQFIYELAVFDADFAFAGGPYDQTDKSAIDQSSIFRVDVCNAAKMIISNVGRLSEAQMIAMFRPVVTSEN